MHRPLTPPTVALVLLALASLASCDDGPAGVEPGTAFSERPFFDVTGPEFTGCGFGTSWASDPFLHYEPPETISLVEKDGGGSVRSQCGALAVGEVIRWSVVYNISDGAHATDNRSTWRARKRKVALSNPQFADQIIVDDNNFGPASFEHTETMQNNYDLLGLEHNIHNDTSPPPPGQNVETVAEVWREITSPTITAVTVVNGDVTINFVNNSGLRPGIDSTRVERDGAQVGSLDAAATEFTETGVPPGTYTYRLRHETLIIPSGFAVLPRPNSAWVDTLVTVPTFPAPTGLVRRHAGAVGQVLLDERDGHGGGGDRAERRPA